MFSGATDADGIRLYHYLLQWSILNWMAETYGANWKAEIMHFDLPDSREGRGGSTLTDPNDVTRIQTDEIQKALDGNPFAKTEVFFPPVIVLPPGTKMSVTVPKKNGDPGKIVFENKLVTLAIATTVATYGHSVGAYGKLVGLSEEQDKILTKISYLINITINYNRWKGGHPRMSEYRAWADQIRTELRDSFDEQLIWARIRNRYLLQRQIEYFGPMK